MIILHDIAFADEDIDDNDGSSDDDEDNADADDDDDNDNDDEHNTEGNTMQKGNTIQINQVMNNQGRIVGVMLISAINRIYKRPF